MQLTKKKYEVLEKPVILMHTQWMWGHQIPCTSLFTSLDSGLVNSSYHVATDAGLIPLETLAPRVDFLIVKLGGFAVRRTFALQIRTKKLDVGERRHLIELSL